MLRGSYIVPGSDKSQLHARQVTKPQCYLSGLPGDFLLENKKPKMCRPGGGGPFRLPGREEGDQGAVSDRG